ncbi:hypothetical protein [Corynebacterium guangdongense]|uniref:Uncharacterized protein n=1 Tax=Corynebacterium guangdongense TaxID=1783348 RepID=A0ABU2A0M5_9CORY|nr:hypothetical protein [Corynebacterium guangdongense]MDR7330716.1 hypothetical protein [Corynebacterium guangdongense]WJZ16731.1 hypothetical protein CGUA_00610 [Corynebacterium guangdongense]
MNITIHSATEETADQIIGDLVEQARLLDVDEVNVFAPSDVLPLLAAASVTHPWLPEGLRFHELVAVA